MVDKIESDITNSKSDSSLGEVRRLSGDSQLEIAVRQVNQIPSHVLELCSTSREHLTTDQSNQLASVLTEYADVFSENDTDLGRFSAIQHSINTGDANPIK